MGYQGSGASAGAPECSGGVFTAAQRNRGDSFLLCEYSEGVLWCGRSGDPLVRTSRCTQPNKPPLDSQPTSFLVVHIYIYIYLYNIQYNVYQQFRCIVHVYLSLG